jgi:regulator of replication initiation timing
VDVFDKIEDGATYEQIRNEYVDAVNIFPALHKYKKEHNTDNLRKLCEEVFYFCRSIYASTANREERDVYRAMLDKLTKK